MALKALSPSHLTFLHRVHAPAVLAIPSHCDQKGRDRHKVRASFTPPNKLAVIGHRGNGMNLLSSSDPRMRAIKENSIRSFEAAAKFHVDFVEFDVQVTRDDHPIIFHDDFILTEEGSCISEKRVTELTLHEFLCYGPQGLSGRVGKSLLRKVNDGKIFNWKVEDDDSLCTLQEAFQRVSPSLGFNIELKLDDQINYKEEFFMHFLEVILQVVFDNAKDRPIIFSTFHPDAAQLVRRLQRIYPVFFLTDGGSEIYNDARRNSIEEAIKLCLEGELQGIVSEVRGIFRNPRMIKRMKEANLSLLTYGQLNNVPEAVYMQHLMGVDGVIVDLVKEISEAVLGFSKPASTEEKGHVREVEEELNKISSPKFSQQELSFLLKLIPELVRH